MKKKTLYLLVIAIAATLLLMLGETKVNAAKVVEYEPGYEITVLDENEWDYTVLSDKTIELKKYKGNASKVYIMDKMYINNELLSVSKVGAGTFDYDTIGNKVNAVILSAEYYNMEFEKNAFKGMEKNKNFAIYLLFSSNVYDEYEYGFLKYLFHLSGINCYLGVPYTYVDDERKYDYESSNFILLGACSNDLGVVLPEKFPTIFEASEFEGIIREVDGDGDGFGTAECYYEFPNATAIEFPNTIQKMYLIEKFDKSAKNLKKIIMPDNLTYFYNEYFLSDGSDVVLCCKPESKALAYAIENNKEFELKTKVNIKSSKNVGNWINTTNKEYTGKAIKTYWDFYYDFHETETNRYVYYWLKEGKDFTVSYKDNKNIGTATVTVKGKGNFTGTITKTFKIVPKKVNLKSVKNSSKKSATVTWKKDTTVTGYEVYVSERVVDKDYMKTTASSLNIRKSTSTKSKIVTTVPKGTILTILKRNVKKEDGYYWYKVGTEFEGDTGETSIEEIGYVRTKYLETVYKAKEYKKVKTITSKKTNSCAIKNLTKGKTYYVKVRSYKTVNGKKLYGSYSNVKTVKIKK